MLARAIKEKVVEVLTYQQMLAEAVVEPGGAVGTLKDATEHLLLTAKVVQRALELQY
jgi:hypothetical protein